MSDRVNIFVCDQHAVAVCAPAGMQREVVQIRVNQAQSPDCVPRLWWIAELQHIAYPCECDHDANRNHWLLRC
jgi:hypothetical protein